jgi:C4-type Zn-finger protein
MTNEPQSHAPTRCCPKCREQEFRIIETIRAARGALAVVVWKCRRCGFIKSNLEDVSPRPPRIFAEATTDV